MKLINKFWNWYDNIKEPYRFLLMLVIVLTPMGVSQFTNNYLFMLLVIPILGTRMYYLDWDKIKNK